MTVGNIRRLILLACLVFWAVVVWAIVRWVGGSRGL